MRSEPGRVTGGAGLFLLACVVGFPREAMPQTVHVTIPQAVAKQIGAQAESANLGILETLDLQGNATIEEEVPVPMRDGVNLSATIVHPIRAVPNGAKSSVILVKTPYSPVGELSRGFRKEMFSRLVRKGYTLVVVNDRGTRWSEGEYHWLRGIKDDGYDTLNWIAAQPWSNGRVGTFGCSSSAEGQLPIATLNHPAHKAMVPIGAATGVGEIPGYSDQGVWYLGGVPQLFWSWWFQIFGHHAHPVMPAGLSQEQRTRLAHSYSPDSTPPYRADLEGYLPSADILKAAGSPETDFDTLMRIAPASQDWQSYDFLRSGDSTKVPGLHMDSWFDLVEIYPTAKLYEYLSRNSPDQYLLVGPTQHCMQGTETEHTRIGENDVGDARFDYASQIIAFFDHFVENDGKGSFDMPKVQFYTMRTNSWTKTDSWPVRSDPYRLYLHAKSAANSLAGGGTLDPHPPTTGETADAIQYDPMNPVPSKGASCCSSELSIDQKSIESRQDVLVYTSDVLTRDHTFTGYVKAKLFVRSTAPDTDIMLKLVDVLPDGRALNLYDTAKRMRYRDGIHHVALMRPSTAYEVTLDQMVTAIRLEKGHRLRIEITSSNFPAYERNLNTGGNNFDESRAVIAKNEILHDPAHASYLELPLMK
ncbi:MAG TPA: CocE/NonD family hydrolase [Steroidobacteraceae bacterium]